MRVSIPGFPGLYYDTDAASTAANLAFTAAGRRAPKPHGYAVQIVPYLWSFEVDLTEVPTDHPIQYLHPEGAQSLGTVTDDRNVSQVGTDIERVFRFVWAVNGELESATQQLIGTESAGSEGVVIEIEDGAIAVDGEQLETDAFDVDNAGAGNSETEPSLEEERDERD